MSKPVVLVTDMPARLRWHRLEDEKPEARKACYLVRRPPARRVVMVSAISSLSGHPGTWNELNWYANHLWEGVDLVRRRPDPEDLWAEVPIPTAPTAKGKE